jgi:DNA polymerase-3 subunit epsilon
MREIIFDTETTGLDSAADRVIEIGALELENRFPTGRTFHHYVNPDGRAIHRDAEAVHGISMAQLADKPRFAEIAGAFAEFCAGAKLVAHNASFDIGFINAEFARLGMLPIDPGQIVDTLLIARRKHPMGPNSLDALCKRYNIDNSHRTKHGALLDAELLAEVYIEMLGGRQAAFQLDMAGQHVAGNVGESDMTIAVLARPVALPPRLTAAERAAHEAAIAALGPGSVWAKLASNRAGDQS